MRKGTNLLIVMGVFSITILLVIIWVARWLALKLRADDTFLAEMEELLKNKSYNIQNSL